MSYWPAPIIGLNHWWNSVWFPYWTGSYLIHSSSCCQKKERLFLVQLAFLMSLGQSTHMQGEGLITSHFSEIHGKSQLWVHTLFKMSLVSNTLCQKSFCCITLCNFLKSSPNSSTLSIFPPLMIIYQESNCVNILSKHLYWTDIKEYKQTALVTWLLV